MLARKNITNVSNLPKAIVQAVANDSYDKGDANISVTGLLKPPRMQALEEKHRDEITEDVSNRVWSLLGQSIHTILERANRTGMAEQRLSIEIEGWKVSGQVDHFEAGILSDYKVTSVYKILQGDLQDWISQLNCYSVLLNHHGYSVKELQVIAILRDWSKHEAKRDSSYPQAQVVNIPIPLWGKDKAFQFMRERVILHQQARVILPECSAEERWAKADVWAVMKPGRKSSVKLCSSEAEALEYAGSDKNLYVVHRHGKSTRCEFYCSCLAFCDQGKKLTNQQGEVDAIYTENKGIEHREFSQAQ